MVEKTALTHDTYRIVLEFPDPSWISGCWASGHFYMHAMINGKLVSTKQTPVSLVNEKGRAVFVIKVYRACMEFPDGGIFTQHLEDNVHVGDSIMCEGPIGKTKYLGNGRFTVKKRMAMPKKKVGLLAGGTGITPTLAIVQAAIMSKDNLDFTFLYSNKTKADILCLDEIAALKKLAPEQFKVNQTLTRHDDRRDGEWSGLTGRVSLEMLKECGFPLFPEDDNFIFICGPKSFTNSIRDMLSGIGMSQGEHFN
jgi:cytochrome-b5 reductase